MKKLNEMSYEDQKHIAELFKCWLSNYTEEVNAKVLPHAEEIINNEMAMYLLEELKTRTEKEKKELNDSYNHIIYQMANGYDISLTVENIHNHCLTNAESYRDVLYDLYIKK